MSTDPRPAPKPAAQGRQALSERDLEQHVLYAMLRPAVQLANQLHVPLKALGQWAELGYFHELRRAGLKMREISDTLEISMRKAAMLSKQLKEGFFEPERHSLERRIEFMVWAEPLSLARLQQTITDHSPEQVQQALMDLIAQDRVVERLGRSTTYSVARGESRRTGEHWTAKIDGLNQLMATITGVISARFFHDEPHARARNLQLRVRREDLPKLQSLYEEFVWEQLRLLDEAAQGHEDAISLDLAICWAPHDYAQALEDRPEPQEPVEPA